MMSREEKALTIGQMLRELHDRSVAAHEKGNLTGSCYLATICGMWANYFKKSNHNMFEDDAGILYRWFANGYEDYSKAIGITSKIRAAMLEKEKIEDVNNKATRGSMLKTGLKMKLW